MRARLLALACTLAGCSTDLGITFTRPEGAASVILARKAAGELSATALELEPATRRELSWDLAVDADYALRFQRCSLAELDLRPGEQTLGVIFSELGGRLTAPLATERFRLVGGSTRALDSDPDSELEIVTERLPGAGHCERSLPQLVFDRFTVPISPGAVRRPTPSEMAPVGEDSVFTAIQFRELDGPAILGRAAFVVSLRGAIEIPELREERIMGASAHGSELWVATEQRLVRHRAPAIEELARVEHKTSDQALSLSPASADFEAHWIRSSTSGASWRHYTAERELELLSEPIASDTRVGVAWRGVGAAVAFGLWGNTSIAELLPDGTITIRELALGAPIRFVGKSDGDRVIVATDNSIAIQEHSGGAWAIHSGLRLGAVDSIATAGGGFVVTSTPDRVRTLSFIDPKVGLCRQEAQVRAEALLATESGSLALVEQSGLADSVSFALVPKPAPIPECLR